MSCPICRNDTVQDYRPFCSRRCADLDLARWMNGGYAVPSQRDDTNEAPDAGQADPPRESKPH